MMGPDVYTYVYHVAAFAVTQMYVQQTLGNILDMCCMCIHVACNMTEAMISKSAYLVVGTVHHIVSSGVNASTYTCFVPYTCDISITVLGLQV